ncbi:MAG: carbon-nitrogen hydrolase family protein, partial [Halobacteriovoraceae bacterium]|nr:carbon-nitrogen hydrolase family protein [Halobacteriovoraceae bacterium]
GKNNENISTYGHSCIIDPWGDVIANCDEGENFAIASLSHKRLEQIRSRMDISAQM